MLLVRPTLLAILSFAIVGCSGGGDQFANILSEGDGGTGNSSVQIDSYSPNSATVVLKSDATKTFLVSARGSSDLTFSWKVNGTSVGTNSTSYTLSASSYSLGFVTLTAQVSDALGTATQAWAVKINGTPTVTSYSPSVASVMVQADGSQDLTITLSDPNGDALSYTWTLDGATTDLTNPLGGSPTTVARYSPAQIDLGDHVAKVVVADGAISDEGTYVITLSWPVVVNNFSAGCNEMGNSTITNRSCVHTGIADIGNDKNPSSSGSSILIRPTDISFTSAGNAFVLDGSNSVVWFWNRNTTPFITVVGQSIPVNTMKVVAGIGIAAASNTSFSTQPLRTHLNAPSGITFDGTDLYIADSSNNLVRKLDAAGSMVTIMGASTYHVDGASAYLHACNNPYSLLRQSNYLYVSCYGSNRVKRVDLTAGTAITWMGTGAAGDPANYNASVLTSGNGILNGPTGLAQDSLGNIYVAEYDGCRIRQVNMTAGAIVRYGTYSIPSFQQRIVVGRPGASCGYAAGEAVTITGATDGQINRPRQIEFDGDDILLYTQHSDHSVGAVNFSASAVVYGAVTVPSYQVIRVFGNGNNTYVGEGIAANTRFSTPYSIRLDPVSGDFLIADHGHIRLRKINGTTTVTSLVAGNGNNRVGLTSSGTVATTDERLNNPRRVVYDTVNKLLIVSDRSNHRIRAVDRYGQVSTFVGIGNGVLGSGGEENEDPNASTMNQPQGVALVGKTVSFGGHLVWADSQNHRIRAYNRSTGSVTLFGVVIDAGKVATVGGNGSSGNVTLGAALAAAFNAPDGLAYDGSNLYIADTSNHCIKRLDSSGSLTVVAGTCGSAGNVDGFPPPGTGRLNSPAEISYYDDGTNQGLFIADRGNTRVRFLRLGGSDANLIAQVPVLLGETRQVACGGTSLHNEGVASTNMACNGVYSVTPVYGSSASQHRFCMGNLTYSNVRCVNVSSGSVATVVGPHQGSSSTNPQYFSGSPLSSTDQNNVPSFINQLAPAATESFTRLASPIGLTAVDNVLYVVEEGSDLVRKVILSP